MSARVPNHIPLREVFEKKRPLLLEVLVVFLQTLNYLSPSNSTIFAFN